MRQTFTAMTYNIWGGWDLPRRTPALRDLLHRRQPDLLGVQELHPDSLAAIDEALPGHERVHGAEPGWQTRSNLWWNAELFTAEEHGTRDVGLLHEDSLLFWVRLRMTAQPEAPPLLLASVHLTFPGHARERETDVSPRTREAEIVGDALQELRGEGAALLCVDINDYARPLWALYDRDFREPFGVLGRTCPITHPVTPRLDRPSPWADVQTVEKAIDWIFFTGPVRPHSAEVVDFFRDGVAPSDHKPVMATFSTVPRPAHRDLPADRTPSLS